MDAGVGGTCGGGFDRCFHPTPKAIMKVITTGIHAIFSYLHAQLSTSARWITGNPTSWVLYTHRRKPNSNHLGTKSRIKGQRTSNEITAMITMPTLNQPLARLTWEMRCTTNDQLRLCFVTLARVWPPRMQFKMENPHMTTRFSKQGTITP